MRDLFDDFLEELRRREAISRGEDPDAGAPRRPTPVGPDDPDDAPDGDDRPPREPGGPRRPRAVRSPPRRRRRRIAWWVLGIVVVALLVLFSFGLDLWTDALWYQSVGFDGVFWTRLGAQVGLFAAAAVGTAAILLLNLALASRLVPAATEGRGGGSFRSLFERLNEAAQNADPDRRPGGRFREDAPRPVTFGADDIPDLTPLAGVVLV